VQLLGASRQRGFQMARVLHRFRSGGRTSSALTLFVQPDEVSVEFFDLCHEFTWEELGFDVRLPQH
jgi:hypothetical protein